MAKLMAVFGLSVVFCCATAQAQMWDCGYVYCCDTPVIVIPVNVIPASVPDEGELIDSADRVHTAQKPSRSDTTTHNTKTANPQPENHPDEGTDDKDS